jgi:P-type Ca2+ transporter type 2C
MSTATAVLLALVLVWEPARGLFRFEPIHADGVLVILASTAGLIVVMEFLKRFWRGRLTA